MIMNADWLDRELVSGTAEATRDSGFGRAIEIASGKFAVVENAREFTLVPWRPVLEPHIDKTVPGIMRSDGISWTIGRGRGGPSIS